MKANAINTIKTKYEPCVLYKENAFIIPLYFFGGWRIGWEVEEE